MRTDEQTQKIQERIKRLPLDSDLYHPTDEEKEFLRQTISEDEDEVKRIVLEVQKESYEEFPYTCIQGFGFINFRMKSNPIYDRILNLGKNDPSALLLDLGCFLGTDVRKLAFDGYPKDRIVGCDLRSRYIELGHKLWNDKDNSPVHFITSDIFTLDEHPPHPSTALTDITKVKDLSDLVGRVKHLYTGSLFHLFLEEPQVQLAIRLAHLLKRVPSSIIFGRQRGTEPAGIFKSGASGSVLPIVASMSPSNQEAYSSERYLHSPSSWEALWRHAFSVVEGSEFASSRIKVDAVLDDGRFLKWSVEIIP